MTPDRRTAILAGILYLVGTLAGLIGIGLEDPILSAQDYLVGIHGSATSLYIGGLLELGMGVALIILALVLYPIIKRYDPRMALGYFGARLIEAVIYIIGVISLFSLVTLSRAFVVAGAPTASHFQTIGALLLGARDWGGHVILDVAVFPLGAFLLYSVLYSARLVPRWLSVWGLIGAVLYWLAAPLVLFNVIVPLSGIHIALQAPLGLQELVLAIWLIAKGFDPSSLATLGGNRSQAAAGS